MISNGKYFGFVWTTVIWYGLSLFINSVNKGTQKVWTGLELNSGPHAWQIGAAPLSYIPAPQKKLEEAELHSAKTFVFFYDTHPNIEKNWKKFKLWVDTAVQAGDKKSIEYNSYDKIFLIG